MAKIFPIPQHIISQIAAGEVIERPVYAVKELVENSLDEAATFISIQIQEGGIEKIVVSDDGNGMSPSDLLESFKPHTTSKLTEESLVGIQTLGFRGEALSSIAAVSDMTIQSRTRKQDSGNQVTIKAGLVQHTGPVGMPYGTVVTVQNLFYPVPARKKFLKSQQTEFRLILDLITRYAFVYPDIRFLLIHNSRTVLDLPKTQTLQDRFNAVFKNDITSQLLPVHANDSYISIAGFIVRPQISSRNHSKQFIFVNDRAINDRQLSAVVKETYGTLLEKTQYPLFMLFLTVPHEFVDVNVHPRKEQVQFANREIVIAAVRSAVTASLSEHTLIYTDPQFKKYSSRTGTTQSYAADVLREKENLWSVKDTLIESGTIQQIHDVYLVAQTSKGFVLIDQHAAHERILYEQLLDSYNKNKQDIFILKKPIEIDMAISDKLVILENIVMLNKMGFRIEENGNELLLISIPEFFKDRDLPKLLTEFSEDIAENGKVTDLDNVSNKMIAYLACRGAIKAGEKLTEAEAKKLINKLSETKNNISCPHGRPTRIELTLQELNKWFKRE